jgi:hypothetical protein
MSKKTYRRLFLMALMLLAFVFLTYTSPRQQAAQEPCEECHANCEAEYELCLQQGSHCEQSRTLCHEACVLVCS